MAVAMPSSHRTVETVPCWFEMSLTIFSDSVSLAVAHTVLWLTQCSGCLFGWCSHLVFRLDSVAAAATHPVVSQRKFGLLLFSDRVQDA